jgi:hypothetical protein
MFDDDGEPWKTGFFNRENRKIFKAKPDFFLARNNPFSMPQPTPWPTRCRRCRCTGTRRCCCAPLTHSACYPHTSLTPYTHIHSMFGRYFTPSPGKHASEARLSLAEQAVIDAEHAQRNADRQAVMQRTLAAGATHRRSSASPRPF